MRLGSVARSWERTSSTHPSNLNDLTVELDIKTMKDCHEFIISLAAAGDLHTDLIYRPEENTLTFDRTFCGLRRDVIKYDIVLP